MYEATSRGRRSRLELHPIKKAWSEGRVAISSWCTLSGSTLAEAFATLDWDCMCIDMQHGLMDVADLVHMLQGIEAAGLNSMIRLPWNDPGLAQRALDIGVSGLICPMVNTREQCEAFVGACLFPPVGYRSFGGARASGYYAEIDDVFTKAHDATVVLAMVETIEGLENLEEIASVPGLDGIFVGPADMTASRGEVPKVGINDPFIMDAHKRILDACRRNGIHAGINASSFEAARELIDLGYNYIALGSDIGLLLGAGRELIREARDYLNKG